MISLDDAGELAALDPGGMLLQVAGLSEQLARASAVRDALRAAHPGLSAQAKSAGAREVLVCGMGGSAIGGDYAATWAHAGAPDLSISNLDPSAIVGDWQKLKIEISIWIWTWVSPPAICVSS